MSEPLHELARRVEEARDGRVAALAARRGCGCSPRCDTCRRRIGQGDDALLAALAALDGALAARDRPVLPPAPPPVPGVAPLPGQRAALSSDA